MTIAALPQYALLCFSGADAQTFLHAQLTCDVQALQTGTGTYGGYCTPKGRLLATFLLWHDAGGYTMQLPSVLAEPIRKRLSMYILRSKVKVENLAPLKGCAGVSGPDAVQAITALGGMTPEQQLGVAVNNDVHTIRLSADRYLVTLPRAQADTLVSAAAGAWEQLDIASGVPFILPETQEEFVPQMVNLDLIGGLSYSKGCYPGQEIVARTHYLGKLKQRMYRVRLESAAVPGDKLYCEELGDQAGGRIVSCAHIADGRHEALAVLQTANARATQYHLGSLQGPALTLLPLPYKPD